MKVIKWLDEHFEETFLVFFLVLISCITMLQIIARTFFAALSWPEEFCRYCWIWSVFISLPYTMRKGNMLRVNVLVLSLIHISSSSVWALRTCGSEAPTWAARSCSCLLYTSRCV